MLVYRDAPPEVTGQVCHALLLQAHYYRGQLVNEANVLFLRLAEGPWHRIFIEAGVVFWQMVDSLDSPDQDRHHYTLTRRATAPLLGRCLRERTPRGRAVAGGGRGGRYQRWRRSALARVRPSERACLC